MLLLLTACLQPQPGASPGCADCHGAGASAAPPAALGGVTDPAYRGVGAHAAHVEGTGRTRPVGCPECHRVPGTLDAPDHVDSDWPAEVAWTEKIGPTTAIFEPYDGAGTTCTVYCHGAGRPDPTGDPPVSWTEAGPLACERCHGNPPPTDGHRDLPAEAACADCHARPPEQHADGRLQVFGDTTGTDTGTDTGTAPPVGGGCAGSCHGANGVPEPADAGHDRHLDPPSSRPVACGDCHPSSSAPTHRNGVADVVLAGVAATGGRAPAWGGGSCSDTWCHAQVEGTAPEPAWADAGAGLACTACHAMAPSVVPAHAGATECTGCHPDAGPGPIIADPSRHVDGSVTQ